MNTPYHSVDDVIWDRPEPARRASVEPLRRSDVVAAAIVLADAEGIGAVSVRRVAAALDAGPMRLYRVFDTIDELTELMVDAVYGEIVEALRPRGTWRTRVRSILLATRDAVLEHTWMADLLGTRPHLGPNGLAWLELLASAVRRAPGIRDVDDTWVALGALNGFVIGAVRREVADRRAGRIGAGELEWQRRVGPYLGRMLDTGRFPTMRELVLDGDDRDPDAAFRAETDLVLIGLTGRTAR